MKTTSTWCPTNQCLEGGGAAAAALTWAVEDEQVLDHLVGGGVEVLEQGRPGQHAVRGSEAEVQLSQERVHLPAAGHPHNQHDETKQIHETHTHTHKAEAAAATRKQISYDRYRKIIGKKH